MIVGVPFDLLGRNSTMLGEIRGSMPCLLSTVV